MFYLIVHCVLIVSFLVLLPVSISVCMCYCLLLWYKLNVTTYLYDGTSVVYHLTGWAAALRYDDNIRRQFDDFQSRSDTFSLGVCNGCQLMALLGWIGSDDDNKG